MNLKPFKTYYYQFNVCDSTKKSPLGRTKTTPRKTDKVAKSIKLAIYSCSNFRMCSSPRMPTWMH